VPTIDGGGEPRHHPFEERRTARYFPPDPTSAAWPHFAVLTHHFSGWGVLSAPTRLARLRAVAALASRLSARGIDATAASTLEPGAPDRSPRRQPSTRHLPKVLEDSSRCTRIAVLFLGRECNRTRRELMLPATFPRRARLEAHHRVPRTPDARYAQGVAAEVSAASGKPPSRSRQSLVTDPTPGAAHVRYTGKALLLAANRGRQPPSSIASAASATSIGIPSRDSSGSVLLQPFS